MLRFLPFAASAALMLILSACANQPAAPGAPQFSCYRQIYNNSSCAWTFMQDPNDVHQTGNMYFGNGTQPNCTQLNGPCVIPASSTVSLQYTYTAATTKGTMKVTDSAGNNKTFSYLSNNPGTCPYIRHSGNTGGASVNEPADGDYTIHQCNW